MHAEYAVQRVSKTASGAAFLYGPDTNTVNRQLFSIEDSAVQKLSTWETHSKVTASVDLKS